MHTNETKTLLILRHAKSSWKHPECSDHERPLNGRGKKDAPRMGTLIAEQNLIPQAILASTAERTRLTSEAFAKAAGYQGPIEFYEQLYGGDAAAYLSVAKSVSDQIQCLMLVGHNPTCEELIEVLADCYDLMPTAALAVIDLPIDTWSDLSVSTKGTLRELWIPKELEPA